MNQLLWFKLYKNMDKKEIIEQLEHVETLRGVYEAECKESFENSDKAIGAFHNWHMAAMELFYETLGDDDQLLQKFRSENVSGNGFTLLSVYHSLLSTYSMLKVKVRNLANQSKGQDRVLQEDTNKPKKIFISHSSKDKNFVHALIQLLNTLGLGEDDIFCSSEPGYWIKKGNFFKVIREQFEQNDLYVIFIQSPRFYASSVSLNEMGAAWAMHSEYYSFLTKDMEYEKMNAVVNNHEIACKVDSKDAKDRLNDWQKELLNYFGKPIVTNMSIWERNRDEFLRKVRKMRYKTAELQKEKSEQPNNSARLTLEERNIMKQWVESNDDSMQYVAFIGGSGTLLLGNVQFEISTAQDKARWRSIFQHLSSCGMIENVGQENGFPKYILTELAYKYFDNK